MQSFEHCRHAYNVLSCRVNDKGSRGSTGDGVKRLVRREIGVTHGGRTSSTMHSLPLVSPVHIMGTTSPRIPLHLCNSSSSEVSVELLAQLEMVFLTELFHKVFLVWWWKWVCKEWLGFIPSLVKKNESTSVKSAGLLLQWRDFRSSDAMPSFIKMKEGIWVDGVWK